MLDENGISGKAKAKQVPHSKLSDVAAARIANDEDADVVEVTSMQMNPAVGTTEVSISVYRRRSDKRWHEVMVVAGRATAGDVTAEQRQRIEKDPQVQQVFRLFSSLGATSQLSNAIGVGAVVEIAQQRAKSRLNQLLLSGTQRPVFRAYVLPADNE